MTPRKPPMPCYNNYMRQSRIKTGINRNLSKVRILGLSLLLAMAAMPNVAFAQQAAMPARAQLEEHADNAIQTTLKQHGLKGAAVVLVANGAIAYAQGYGTAGESGEKIDPATTVFPLDSIAKVLTGTAVMQLVDDGKLDLDTDINNYLQQVHIPDRFPGKPITLRHLLTHTAGFEEKVIGILPASPNQIGPLGNYLAQHQPERVRPPGEFVAYSNYGLALAGLIVEEVSNTRFDTYMAKYVLQPLGMGMTSFAQPLPDDIKKHVATMYERQADGTQTPAKRSGDFLVPAGGAWTTAADMGKFICMQIGGCDTGGQKILSSATLTELQKRQFGGDPRLPGMALSFEERYLGSLRMLAHGGDGPGSHSALAIAPDTKTGAFVVFNSDGTDGTGPFAAHEVAGELMLYMNGRQHTDQGNGPIAAAPKNVAKAVSGTFRTTRMNTSDFTKLFIASSTDITVKVNSDGTLTTTRLSLDPSSKTQHWNPAGEGLYQEKGSGRLLAFATVNGATVLYEGASTYQQLPGHQTLTMHLLLITVGVLLLWSCIAWPLGNLFRRLRKKQPKQAQPQLAKIARLTMGLTAILVLTFVIALVALVADSTNFLNSVLEGRPVIYIAFLPLTFAAIGMLATAVFAVMAWQRSWWTIGMRIHFTLAAFGGLLLLAVLHSYNFITAPFGVL
jgi:CubicO group peptidase (beta-lactamase class C family)